MIYRMLALNIDGTLLQTNGKIHKSTKEAIEYVQQKGIYVTLVTSRTFASAKKVAKALKLDNILITHRGAYIAKEIGKPIHAARIQENITYDLVRLLEGFPCQIRLVHENYSLANKYKLNHNLLAKTVFTTGDPVFYSQQFVDSIGDMIIDEPANPSSIEVYFEYKDDLIDVQEAIQRMFTEVDCKALNELRLDIVPVRVSKLNGLLYLAERLGISRNEIVCIGDDSDDIEMIEAAGLGVAMGNASVEVKRAADWITRSQNQQGVAYMVKEHFRKQQPIEFLRKMNIIK
ncbi:Cof-type HAD-IIB family hydrolase [Niallia endozanthoxylica]|uniref:HAD family phosphatase n=1 Tax=Niallia endozanthoxylica TaxID=2036016 RepID=A0A5J5I7N4_9BACI|nr:Cof-type HAD-IIB family hydrolase [Niallia endozanthoxylica]KAA9031637.1 HAD family phosphatase [Niallia endozanthoxylica]